MTTEHAHDTLEQELRSLQRTTRRLRGWALALGLVVMGGTVALLLVSSQARYLN